MKKLVSTSVFLFLSLLSYSQFIEHVYNYDSDDLPFINEVRLADMDGDGLQDYITLGHQSRTVSVFYNNGFDNEPTVFSFTAESALRNLVLFDFDQDDDMDIIASAPFDDTSFWYSNDGNGAFTENSFPLPTDYDSMIFTDMDGDGMIDLLANVDDALRIYDVTPSSLTLRKQIDSDSFSLNYKAMRVSDVNNDGQVDILVAEAFDGIILYEQSSTDEFTKVELLPDVFSVERLDIHDLNDDGHFDIVASSPFNGTCKIQINNGDNTFTEEKIEPETERIEFAMIADYDNDGDKDIVYYDGGFGVSGLIKVYVNNQGSWTQELFSNDHPRTETGTVGDIDGDGDEELVFGKNPFFETELVVFENDGPVSSLDISNIDFEIYPTLTSDIINIRVNRTANYKIINQSGRIIRTGYCAGVSALDVEDIDNGIYYLKLIQGTKIETTKFIKL